MGKPRVKSERGALIRVSPQVKAKLEAMKARNGHTTLDSVIRQVLSKAGESI